MTFMTIGSAIIYPDKDSLPKLGMGAFNGLVLAGLIWLGRWLRRRSLKPVADQISDSIQ
jgi:hypothetical protein